MPTLRYYRRIFSAYLLAGKSHLTFWHETPTENSNVHVSELGEYYMLFTEKADYRGAYDPCGIPQLDYHGNIGLQYNPIAIAQYGLGNYNLWRRTGEPGRKTEVPPDCRLALLTSRAQRSRSRCLEPLFQLGVPRHAQGAVVLSAGARAGNFSSSSRT